MRLKDILLNSKALQTLGLSLVLSSPFLVPLLPMLMWYMGRWLPRRLAQTPRWFLLIYVLWAWGLDKTQPFRGGRPIHWLRSNWIWELFRRYFSTSIVHADKTKLEEIAKQGKACVFGYHPHGWFAVGALGNLIAHNPDAFPLGMQVRVAAASINSWVPIWRDFCMALNTVDAGRQSLEYCLSHGISVVILIGGADEARYARPNSLDLILARRKGFVRLAMEQGASLVPMIFLVNQISLNPSLETRTTGSMLFRTGSAQDLDSYFHSSEVLVVLFHSEKI